MHLTMICGSGDQRDTSESTPTQLHLFGPPRRTLGFPVVLTTAVFSAIGAFALVYAAQTFVQRSTGRIRGDVLDDDRFQARSPAHAGYDA